MIKRNELDVFLNKINDCDYLILRGFDGLLESLNQGGDIDILVRNREDFILQSNAKPMNGSANIYNYSVTIGSATVPVDLRFVGDGYYDYKWEEHMLVNKKRYENTYVMGEEDYLFSIIYHCIIHKKTFPHKYEGFIHQNGITTSKCLKDRLDLFMVKKGYKYVIPKDRGVDFNKNMFYLRKVHYTFLKLKSAFRIVKN